jgi:DNA polymerase III delta prime subunit
MTRLQTVGEVHHDFSVQPHDTLDAILGCEKAKKALLTVLRHPGVPPKLFLAGPPGSGKSSLVRAGLALIACDHPVGDRPCTRCPGCIAFRSTGGRTRTGFFADHEYQECRRPIDYLRFNCRTATIAEIEKGLKGIRWRQDALRIIHLEEAASLYRDRRDERLTEYMDDTDFSTCRWIATAVNDSGLDEQFRRRWNLKVATSPPSTEQLAFHLAGLCRDYGIKVEDPRTWELLAELSRRVAGHALSLLPIALMEDPPHLSRAMVLDYPLQKDDPWVSEFFQRRTRCPSTP